MKTSFAIIAGYILYLFLSSSNLFFDKAMTAFSSKYSIEVTLSKNYLSMLQSHNFTGIEQNLDPSVNRNQAVEALNEIAELFPIDKPTSIALIGLYRSSSADNHLLTTDTTTVSFEYEFPDRWVYVQLVLKDSGEDRTIFSLYAKRMSESLKETNAFSLSGKSLIEYVFLAVVCATSLITVAALIVCVRSTGIRRKWLWVIFILFGFVVIFLNWNDNTFSIQLLSFHVPSTGFGRSGPYSPMIIFASIPVGAIIFLIRYKKLWLLTT